jgi:hypothetical protein
MINWIKNLFKTKEVNAPVLIKRGPAEVKIAVGTKPTAIKKQGRPKKKID